MVTLRSDRKLTAVSADSTPSRSRKATGTPNKDRSVTPDRGSQDSILRRSQRVRKRQSMLGIIPEDTADSAASPDQSADVDRQKSEAEQAANTSTITSAETGPAAPQVAEALLASIQQADTDETAAELASPLPAVAISSDQRHNSNSANSEAESDSDTDASSEAGTEACESDDSDQLLAQLSESMWASLRPEPLSQHSSGLPSSSGQAQDAGGQLQPLSAQQHYTAGNDEEEMHWTPLTGLPEPLSAAACKGAGVRPDRNAHVLEKQLVLPPRDTRPLLRQQRKLAPETAGKQWFDLPAPQLTDEVKRDLKLLQLRGTFDPKRFYKSSDHKKSLPKFFQIGTVVESAADFYSGRLTNHERKATITEELLADPELSQVRKRRFNKLQDEKHYWANKRSRKTDLPRLKKNDRSKVKRMSR